MLGNINRIRVFSCLLIAFFHVTQFFNANQHGLEIPLRQTPGFHLFLVVSGFILFRVTRPHERPLRFMLRRVARIVPLYWALTLAAIALAAWHFWYFPAADLSPSGIWSSFLFEPHVNRRGLIQPILFVGWTLNYLMVFYLLFALALLAPARARAWVVAALIAAIVAGANLLAPGPARAFYGDPIQFEFAAGVLTAAAMRHKRVAAWVRARSMLPLALAGVAGLAAASIVQIQGPARLLAYGLPAVLLVFAAAGQDIFRTPPKLGPIGRLAPISYAIYLVHPLIIPLVGVLIVGRFANGWIDLAVMTPIVFALVIGAAYLCHVLIEQPANTWLRRRFGVEGPAPLRQPKAPPKAPPRGPPKVAAVVGPRGMS